MNTFRIIPVIETDKNSEIKKGYKVEKKKLFGWELCGVTKGNGFYSYTIILFFESVQDAYDWIRQEYGNMAEVVEWKGK